MTQRRSGPGTVRWRGRRADQLRMQASAVEQQGRVQVAVALKDRSGRRLQRQVGIALEVFAEHGYRLVSQDQIYDSQPTKLAYYRTTLIFERRGSEACGSCGAGLPAAAKFCTVCGQKI